MNRFSIRIAIPLITLIIVVISLSVAYFTSRSMAYARVVTVTENSVRDRLTYVQSIAEQLIKLDLKANLAHIVSSFASEPDLQRFIITDENGLVAVSNRFSDVGKHWTDINLSLDSSLISQAAEQSIAVVQHNPSQQTIDGVTRVCQYQTGLVAHSNACGFTYYQITLQPHYGQVDQQLTQQSTLIGLEITVGSVILLLLLSTIVTKPALRIEQALSEFNSGKRETQIHITGNNELAKLGRLINQMFQEIHRNERQLEEKEERLRATFDAVADSIITINDKGIIESVNPATVVLFEYQTEELIGRNINILMADPHHTDHDEYIQHYITTRENKIIGKGRDIEARRKDGSMFPIHLSISEMRVEGKLFFTGSIQDITERKQLEKSLIDVNNQLLDSNLSLHESAITDGLTGLFNRKHFDAQLDEELRRACRNGEPLSLLLCDIDHFKLYNDSLGHQAGDQCLQTVADLFKKAFQRAGEFTARYGGEELVVVLPHLKTEQAMNRAAQLQQMLRDLGMPHAASPTADHVTISIGCACYRPGKQDERPRPANELIEQADQALYSAKNQGRNQVVSADESTAHLAKFKKS